MTLTLCNRRIRFSDRLYFLAGPTRVNTTADPDVQTVTQLDFDESEAFSLLSFFFCLFYFLQPYGDWLKHPPYPNSLTRRGGGVFCLLEKNQCVCNNKPPRWSPSRREEGGGGQGRCLKARHAVGLSTLYRR